jgi:hypothetical protein
MDVTWMDDCCNIVALDRLRTVLAGTIVRIAPKPLPSVIHPSLVRLLVNGQEKD